MGALFALFAARVTAALKHQAAIYGLMAAAGVISIFAAGYALDAGHSALMFRYGAITASLVIAGCLIAGAIVCLIAARIVANRPSKTAAKLSALASSYSPSQIRLPFSPQTLIAAGAGLTGAISVALFMLPKIRDRLRGRAALPRDM
ncbi:hypothetical protein [Bosea rubneri]|uniref:Uncharacterized protein n=1 Tax=Bosea rubneri TaxID=3075434 RepID=A0ABU3SFL7_9HYPH|nr:hypothetical protein [Bosea sp. ZW T0_25]MDU0343170.1 hypothetical protein [Bosea sp. ZW T0_25]